MLIPIGSKAESAVLHRNILNNDNNGLDLQHTWVGSALSNSGKVLVTVVCRARSDEVMKAYQNGPEEKEEEEKKKKVLPSAMAEGEEASFQIELTVGVCADLDLSLRSTRRTHVMTVPWLHRKRVEGEVDRTPLDVHISSDEQYMACTIPFSTVVLFDLEGAGRFLHSSLELPPLSAPFRESDEITLENSANERLIEAVNPRTAHLTHGRKSEFAKIATVLCDLKKHPHYFLAGCLDGSILLLDWSWRRPLAKVLYDGNDDCSERITAMDDNFDSTRLAVNSSDGICLFDINAKRFSDEKEKRDIFCINLKFSGRLGSSKIYQNVIWLASTDLLACKVNPDLAEFSSSHLVEVWTAPSTKEEQGLLTSTFLSTNSKIQELYESRIKSKTENNTSTLLPSLCNCFRYHEKSGCLSLCIRVAKHFKSFVCLWNWRSDFVSSMIETTSESSSLYLRDEYNGLHIYFDTSSIIADAYHYANICPNNSFCSVQYEPSPFFMTRKTVSIISATPAIESRKASDCRHSCMVWDELKFPPEYDDYGSPRIASSCHNNFRAIAFAFERGLCVLDLYRNYHPHIKFEREYSVWSDASPFCSSSRYFNNHSDKRHVGRRMAKWRTFKEDNESSFRVHALCWWEIESRQIADISTPMDILMAAIELNPRKLSDSKGASKNGLFRLVAWSKQSLGFGDDQLLRCTNSLENADGIVLRSKVTPQKLSISGNSKSNDEVILLVSSYDPVVVLEVYSLQLLWKKVEKSNFLIGAKLWIFREDIQIGSGLTYSFVANWVKPIREPYVKQNEKNNLAYAVIGVVTKTGGLAALLISPYFEFVVVEDFHELQSKFDSQVINIRRVNLLSSTKMIRHRNTAIWTITMANSSVVFWCFSHLYLNFIPKFVSNSSLGTVKSNSELSALFGTVHVWKEAYAYCSDISIGEMPGSISSPSILCVDESHFYEQNSCGDHGFIKGVSRVRITLPAFSETISCVVFASDKDEASLSDGKALLHVVLSNYVFDGSLMSSLSEILVYILEKMSNSKSKTEKHILRSKFFILELARKMLTTLQYVALIVHTARQLEPSLHALLFPINGKSDREFLSFESLYEEASNLGSILVSSTTLPLFCSKIKTISECSNLLDKTLKFGSYSLSKQLFSFGLKLHSEDYSTRLSEAEFSEANNYENISDDSIKTDDDSSFLPSQEDLDSPSKLSNVKYNFLCRLFVKDQSQSDESLIQNAASSFIISTTKEGACGVMSENDSGIICQNLSVTKCSVINIITNHIQLLLENSNFEDFHALARIMIDEKDVCDDSDLCSFVSQLLSSKDMDIMIFEESKKLMDEAKSFPLVSKLIAKYAYMLHSKIVSDTSRKIILDYFIFLADAEKSIHQEI